MIARSQLLTIAILPFLLGWSSETGPQAIEIPRGGPIVVDGQLSQPEWSGALVQDLVNGGQLRLRQDASYLYVGLEGTSAGFGHLCLTDGETIYVLHASASLGTAVYRRSDGAWKLMQGFSWELKGVGTEATAVRSRYLESQGWLSNTIASGLPNVREFQVSRKFVKNGGLKMAAVFSSGMNPQFWPKTISDDCLLRELVFGSAPATLKFGIENWATLRL